jgi:hypothetical protein
MSNARLTVKDLAIILNQHLADHQKLLERVNELEKRVQAGVVNESRHGSD